MPFYLPTVLTASMAIFLCARISQVEAHVDIEEQEQKHGNLRRSLLGLSAAALPKGLDLHVADVIGTPFDPEYETAVFWKLSKTGSSISVQPYLSDCLNLVIANEVGSTLSNYHDSNLSIVQLPSERRYLNVDTTTVQGLSQTKARLLPQTGLADVIISPLLKEVTALFDTTYRGRFFTVLSHPVQRAVSTFFHLQHRAKETGDANLVRFINMTLKEYAESDLVESNYMVRSLVNKPTGALLPTDLYLAKIILRQKFLIGLSDKMDQSLERIRLYFGWHAVDHYRLGVFQRVNECKAQYLSEGHISKNRIVHAQIDANNPIWALLHQKNWADVSLYEFARDVYRQQQESLFPNM